ncbi:MAG TPA: hypothetical protein VF336_05615 [Syntrophales bacterium]
MEMIEVKSGKNGRGTYTGLVGTFATIVECCLRKKVLPGFHKEGLIADATLKDKTLTLTLSGKQTGARLTEMMEIALLNIGAYPDNGSGADFIIDVQSEQ